MERHKSNVCLCSVPFIISAVIAYFGYLFSTTPYFFNGNNGCIVLKSWTYNFSIFLFSVIIWDTLLTTVGLIGYWFNSYSLISIKDTCYNYINPLIFMIHIIFYLVLTWAYSFGENCGICGTFVYMLLFLFWLIVGISLCCIGCSLCCCYEWVRGFYHNYGT